VAFDTVGLTVTSMTKILRKPTRLPREYTKKGRPSGTGQISIVDVTLRVEKTAEVADGGQLMEWAEGRKGGVVVGLSCWK
jgi:hypothetical protein